MQVFVDIGVGRSGVARRGPLTDHASEQKQGHHDGRGQYNGKPGAVVHMILTRRDRQTVAVLPCFFYYMPAVRKRVS